MKYGKCATCSAPILKRSYKLSTGPNHYRELYRCEKTIGHSYTSDQLIEIGIDVDYYRELTEWKLKHASLNDAIAEQPKEVEGF